MKEINYTILYWVCENFSHSIFISDPDPQQYEKNPKNNA